MLYRCNTFTQFPLAHYQFPSCGHRFRNAPIQETDAKNQTKNTHRSLVFKRTMHSSKSLPRKKPKKIEQQAWLASENGSLHHRKNCRVNTDSSRKRTSETSISWFPDFHAQPEEKNKTSNSKQRKHLSSSHQSKTKTKLLKFFSFVLFLQSNRFFVLQET